MPETKVQVHTLIGEQYIPVEVERLPSGSFTVTLNGNVTLFFDTWDSVTFFVSDFNHKLRLCFSERRPTNEKDSDQTNPDQPSA